MTAHSKNLRDEILLVHTIASKYIDCIHHAYADKYIGVNELGKVRESVHTLIIHSTIATGNPIKAIFATARSACSSRRLICSASHLAAAATHITIMIVKATAHQSMQVEDEIACCTRVARTAPLPKHSST